LLVLMMVARIRCQERLLPEHSGACARRPPASALAARAGNLLKKNRTELRTGEGQNP